MYRNVMHVEASLPVNILGVMLQQHPTAAKHLPNTVLPSSELCRVPEKELNLLSLHTLDLAVA